MNILYYSDLDYSKVKKQFKRIVGFLKNNDFASAEVKKMINTGFYRAKLDYENRLLFKFARCNDEMYLLVLEVIYNHEYEKSRFLRGAEVDESKLIPLKETEEVAEEETGSLPYVNTSITRFHLLDKVISFDEVQEAIFNLPPPVIIIGSAGSGKTVLTLEKIKQLQGDILYVTLSPYLVENSSRLYYSNHYINESQDIDFLSFREYLETLKIIKGKELDFKTFEAWFHPRANSFGIKDAHKLFEEFRGVITGNEITKEYLSGKEYLGLGIKQSIFLSDERVKAYNAFEKYIGWLDENGFYDMNRVSFRWLGHCIQKYDFIVIDEVQDFTNIQLYIVLKSLKTARNFILCGDSNQIVHPNFFSWSNVKTMFYHHDRSAGNIRILRTNYRNSVDVTGLANRLLKIKNARFGSIDKESTFLVEPVAENKGEVVFLKDNPAIRKQLNDKTGRSAKYAVLVMNTEEKIEARKFFSTPLIFSIQEAKGLEYENIVMINFISGNSREFHEIAGNLTIKDIDDEGYAFSRARNKADKSLDAYKFYINSLYVAITRAVKNLYILESSRKHQMFLLMELVESKDEVKIEDEVSTVEEWKEEARKLEMQGKQEQADEIRKTILEIQKPDWDPITPENIEKLKEEALNTDHYNKKAKDTLFAYSLIYNDIESIDQLTRLKYKKAGQYERERSSVFRKYYQDYAGDHVKAVEQNVIKYGINYRDQFNLTPLLAAIQNGSLKILDFLTRNGADTSLTDNIGRNALQIALTQSFFIRGYIQTKLSFLYPGLVTDYVRIKVDDRLVKIGNRKIEYFLFNFFISLQGALTKTKRKYKPRGITAGDIEEAVSDYPETILPTYRKKRSYLSANLSKNEMVSTNPYNKKLFYRVERGNYVLNPDMEILVNDDWKNVYDLMQLEKVKPVTKEEKEISRQEEIRQWRRDELINERYFRQHVLQTLGKPADYDISGKADQIIDEFDEHFENMKKMRAESARLRKLAKGKEKEIKRNIKDKNEADRKKKEDTEELQYKLPF